MGHIIEVDRLYAGQITAHHKHRVSSLVGLVRIVRGYQQGQGHGAVITLSATTARALDIKERGGSLWAGACELSMGRIERRPQDDTSVAGRP